MSYEIERKNTSGCVAKRGPQICKDTAASSTAGLLCPEHLGDLRTGNKVTFRAGLGQYQLAQIATIKEGIDPLGTKAKAAAAKVAAEKEGAQRKTKTKSDKKVEQFLPSFPAIFALTGTSTLLLFEQAWTTRWGHANRPGCRRRFHVRFAQRLA